MPNCRRNILFAGAALCAFSLNTLAADMQIGAGDRAKVVEAVARQMAINYVFADVAAHTGEEIRARLRRGEYDRITSATEFAALLRKQVQEISHDAHAGVYYSEPLLEQDRPAGYELEWQKLHPTEHAANLARMSADAIKRNFGFGKYERLEGNIAYLKIDGFLPTEIAADAAHGEMRKLAGADALIIDLRGNGGGKLEMELLIAAYLFDDQPVHFTDQVHRRIKQTKEFWTTPVAADVQFGGINPVYILTDDDTFSAAEGFAYALQAMKRATIVGATTAGGAHASRSFYLDDHFFAMIPNILTVSSITHADWEGKGVGPDVAVPADQALLAAQLMAIKPLIEKAKSPESRVRAVEAMKLWQAKLDQTK